MGSLQDVSLLTGYPAPASTASRTAPWCWAGVCVVSTSSWSLRRRSVRPETPGTASHSTSRSLLLHLTTHLSLSSSEKLSQEKPESVPGGAGHQVCQKSREVPPGNISEMFHGVESGGGGGGPE